VAERMTRMRIRSNVFQLAGKVWTPRRAVKAAATRMPPRQLWAIVRSSAVATLRTRR